MRQENAVWIPMSFPVRQSDVVYKAGTTGVRNEGSGEYG